MGKAERNRQRSARARIAAQQAAARRHETRRRALLAGGSVVAVIAVLVALIVGKALEGGGKPKPSAATGPVASASTEAQVIRAVTSLPAIEFNAIGAGPSGTVAPLQAVTSKAAVLTSAGKPEMLYIGAEWCPYCAAERWAMVAALSRFGTFSGLHLIHSDPNDIYSNTMTLSFYRSSYTSKYLVFTAVETGTVNKATLQTPTPAQQAVMNTYDSSGSKPFIDVGNRYAMVGSQYLPAILGAKEPVDASHYGLTWMQIAQNLQNPNNSVSQAIIGSANYITAAICKMTHGQPGNVCNSAAVTSIKQI